MNDAEELYKSLCSTETLCSGKKGFFHDFSEFAAETAGEQWTTKIFGRIGKDEDRLRAIFTDKKIKDVVQETLSRVKTLYRGKDAEVSRQKRNEAFKLAAAGQNEKALLLFSQAVLRAPGTGKFKAVDQGFSLPLALLGRAEIFIATMEHDLALEDLNLAAETDLPDKLKAELARKKEECETFLRKNENSLVPVQPGSGTPGDKGLRRTVRNRKPVLPRLSRGENPDLPGASSLLRIQETLTVGKQAVATKKIVPGDVLVVEQPLAACLLPEFLGTHCQHCFSRLRAPIGCPECSSVAFCCRKCRDIAITTYHKYECKILVLLIGSGMSVLSTVALRMVTQEGPRRCLEIYRALAERKVEEEERETEGSTDIEVKLSKSAKRRMRRKKLKDSKCTEKNGGADGEDSRTLRGKREDDADGDVDVRAYDLVMHETKRSPKDFLERSLMASFLLRCLQRVNFFERPGKDDEIPGEEEMAVGTLLLKNLQLLQFNAHEFFETRLGEKHRFRGSKPVYVGVAIYPTVARFNHDCYPAVTRYFVGRNIVIRATRPLNPGDVVAENYGPIFTKRSLEERQRTLAGRYWFRCSCKACQEDWPRFESMTNDSARLRCPSEGCTKVHPQPRESGRSIKCSGCQRRISLERAVASLRECERLYEQGFTAMEEERIQQAIEIFIQTMMKFHEIAVPPHKDTHLAEIALSSCMADSGNTWRHTID